MNKYQVLVEIAVGMNNIIHQSVKQTAGVCLDVGNFIFVIIYKDI
jgi:hypothetical protein